MQCMNYARGCNSEASLWEPVVTTRPTTFEQEPSLLVQVLNASQGRVGQDIVGLNARQKLRDRHIAQVVLFVGRWRRPREMMSLIRLLLSHDRLPRRKRGKGDMKRYCEEPVRLKTRV